MNFITEYVRVMEANAPEITASILGIILFFGIAHYQIKRSERLLKENRKRFIKEL